MPAESMSRRARSRVGRCRSPWLHPSGIAHAPRDVCGQADAPPLSPATAVSAHRSAGRPGRGGGSGGGCRDRAVHPGPAGARQSGAARRGRQRRPGRAAVRRSTARSPSSTSTGPTAPRSSPTRWRTSTARCNIAAAGSSYVVATCAKEVAAVAAETGATSVHLSADYSRYAVEPRTAAARRASPAVDVRYPRRPGRRRSRPGHHRRGRAVQRVLAVPPAVARATGCAMSSPAPRVGRRARRRRPGHAAVGRRDLRRDDAAPT